MALTISKKEWKAYIEKLSKLNTKAADEMRVWVNANGLDDMYKVIAKAYELTNKYGEAVGALTCEMYDAIAVAQGANVPPAVPAQTANQVYVERAVQGASLRPDTIPNTVGRIVKQTGADTMLQNAKRDGAYFAWIPSGDTCAFCITLASNGWRKASRKTIQGNHATHIHNNCNCEFCIDFKGDLIIDGYDPEALEKQYYEADGISWQNKVNSMRRDIYAQNKDEINAQARANYEQRKQMIE